jgi:hypothetical protein
MSSDTPIKTGTLIRTSLISTYLILFGPPATLKKIARALGISFEL